MHFIEFIEALGHVAEYKKWADLEEVLLILLQDVHLSIKLERVIDSLLPLLDKRRSSINTDTGRRSSLGRTSTNRRSSINRSNSRVSVAGGRVSGISPTRQSNASPSVRQSTIKQKVPSKIYENKDLTIPE